MKFRALITAAAVAICCANPASADSHYSKTVSLLQIAVSGCYFFQLTGVTQADPVVANSPWFAIQTSKANAREMYAILLSARLQGTTVSRVLTSGSTVCGHAEVGTIDL
jgi:hypothetical protein